MEKIHKNIRVFILSCIKHACFHVFSPFSAYFSPHDIIAEKGLLPTFLPAAIASLWMLCTHTPAPESLEHHPCRGTWEGEWEGRGRGGEGRRAELSI